MRRLTSLFAALALASCGAPFAAPPDQCRPTVVQPSGPPQLLGRVAGCPDLVRVAGASPGIVLEVERWRLAGVSDAQIDALPLLERGL